MLHASAESRAPVHLAQRRLVLRWAVAAATLLVIRTALLVARAARVAPQVAGPAPALRLQPGGPALSG